MGVECDYCLIAARMLGLLVAVLLALLAYTRLPPGYALQTLWHAFRHIGHLGARGPPSAA